jgi:hypothetical protein
MEKKPVEKRKTRKPLFQRGPQAISGDKDKDYHYRFVNDIGSRVYNFQEAGYEFVSDSELAVGDSRVIDPNDISSRKRVVSNDGTVSYLMRIKKEFYDEDQTTKMEHVDESETSMKRDASQGMYGSIKLS